MLALLWGFLLLLATWRPLALPDEGRYGEIGRWMLVSGDWLVPRINGIPFFHKPPLLYWLEALSMGVFGAHPWAVRLVPALHAGLMLLALFAAARLAGGEALARRAALMLGTSLAFLIGGQYVNHDMMVACWIGVTLWCLAAWTLQGEQADPRLALLAFAASALGVLSKGLIGFVLPGLVWLVWLAWTRQLRKVLQLPWLRGVAVFALLAAPWFVMVHQQYPGALNYLFGTHQVGRFTGTHFNNARAWWFYLACLPLLMFPWLFFIRPSRPGLTSPQKAWRSLLWIWVAVIVGFFSVPNSKIVGYVLPVMPPLALLAAMGWDDWFKNKPLTHHRMLPALGFVAAVLAICATVAAGRYSLKQSSQDVATTLACAAAPKDKVYFLEDFAYDLPFYARSTQPAVVLRDWAEDRRSAGDNWKRELFEGANFDAQAGAVLQAPDVLAATAQQAGNWLMVPKERTLQGVPAGWTVASQGQAWTLLRSAGEGPEAAQQKSLAGCQHQGR